MRLTPPHQMDSANAIVTNKLSPSELKHRSQFFCRTLPELAPPLSQKSDVTCQRWTKLWQLSDQPMAGDGQRRVRRPGNLFPL